MIAMAAARPDWVLGFEDETWWTRLAQPDLFAWAAGDPLRLGANAKDPKGGGPEAVACYGVLRLDNGGMMLRFAEGRPVSATTEDFLGWVCRDGIVTALFWRPGHEEANRHCRGRRAAHLQRRMHRAARGHG